MYPPPAIDAGRRDARGGREGRRTAATAGGLAETSGAKTAGRGATLVSPPFPLTQISPGDG